MEEKETIINERFDDIYIHGVGKMSPHRHKHACCSHIVVYATKTVKTAHIKAKKQSHPHIYTVLCMHAHKLTQRDKLTLSAHLFGLNPYGLQSIR